MSVARLSLERRRARNTTIHGRRKTAGASLGTRTTGFVTTRPVAECADHAVKRTFKLVARGCILKIGALSAGNHNLG